MILNYQVRFKDGSAEFLWALREHRLGIYKDEWTKSKYPLVLIVNYVLENVETQIITRRDEIWNLIFSPK